MPVATISYRGASRHRFVPAREPQPMSALMGAIMGVGVATANAILLVTFANNVRKEGRDARAAALEAGHTRLRPVLMTALAMIIAILPVTFANDVRKEHRDARAAAPGAAQ
eukprot:gene50686-68935_t